MDLYQTSQDYQRIACALAYLRQNYRLQPSLRELAAEASLSEAHFQRMFTRWAGISPKRFVQFLTVEYAKSSLAGQASLLDVSVDAGLSGPGRLHDLFVHLEAMSPGEYRRCAADMEIAWGLVPTPFGEACLAFTSRGICHLAFTDGSDPAAELRSRWPLARFVQDAARAEALAGDIFLRADAHKPVSAWVVGTNFQVQVWRALLQIPSGELESYRGLAQTMGQERSARAVGTAIGRNAIAYLIPCHRVLRLSGEVGEYHWGADRKAAMFAWEAAQNL